MRFLRRISVAVFCRVVPFVIWLITGVKARWQGCEPKINSRVYFANHSSHGDFVLIWSSLPYSIQRKTRPVAAADYWLSGPIRRFIGCSIFNALLVDRKKKTKRQQVQTDPNSPPKDPTDTPQNTTESPPLLDSTDELDASCQVLSDDGNTSHNKAWLNAMSDRLNKGCSLILFPEGTRNNTEEFLLPFKAGIYHLSKACPNVEFIPVWLENVNRVLPKGDFVPLPLLCSVTFGNPIKAEESESKADFLARARKELLLLAPTVEED